MINQILNPILTIPQFFFQRSEEEDVYLNNNSESTKPVKVRSFPLFCPTTTRNQREMLDLNFLKLQD